MATLASIFVGLIAIQPNTFLVVRDTVIHGTPDQIVGEIVDFRTWREWSPWEKFDPKMQRRFSGALKGEGAVYTWRGEGIAGEGRMEVIHVSDSRIGIKLYLERPYREEKSVEFYLAPSGNSTRVTWYVSGRQTLAGKFFNVFFDAERVVGDNAKLGLANLKSTIETH